MKARAMGRVTGIAVVLCAAGALAMGGYATANADAPKANDSTATVAEASVLGQHAALGVDLAGLGIEEVSVASCVDGGCHGGSYQAVREKTDAMWEGVGQIGAANPHDGHGSSGYVCGDCHTLSAGPSVNQCNGCHNFASPEGWEDKDPMTTQYGATATVPLY